VVTAAQLAAKLGISQRTLYRDIQDLSLAGVPILGEAGVGYRMGAGFDVPPIMFTFDEIEVLVAGIRMMESWGGPALAASGRSALEKITHALPEGRRREIESAHMYAPGFHVPEATYAYLDPARRAIAECEKLLIGYRDVQGAPSDRIIRPLGLYFWARSGRWSPGARRAPTSAPSASTASPLSLVPERTSPRNRSSPSPNSSVKCRRARPEVRASDKESAAAGPIPASNQYA
jgi:hypothetical protein